MFGWIIEPGQEIPPINQISFMIIDLTPAVIEELPAEFFFQCSEEDGDFLGEGCVEDSGEVVGCFEGGLGFFQFSLGLF